MPATAVTTMSPCATPALVYDEERQIRSSKETLERLARLGTQLLKAPTSLISLIEPHRQIFAATYGVPDQFATVCVLPLTYSMCQYVVKYDRPLIVGDAVNEPLFQGNLAIPAFGVGAYLGVPLRNRHGVAIGSFCVLDRDVRNWTESEVAVLDDIAQGVMAELDNRDVCSSLADTTESYSELLDSTTELVCTADGNGVITYVNRAWREAFGFTAEEAIGMRAVDLLAAEHRPRYVEVARRLHTGERVDGFEVVTIGKYGKRVVCRGSATASMEVGEDGSYRCVGTRAVYRDLTQQRVDEQSRARLAATLEATGDLVCIARGDGRFEFLNTAGRRLLNIGEDVSVDSLSTQRVHPPSTLALLNDEAFPAAARYGVWRGNAELLDVHGVVIPVAISMTAQPSLTPGDPPYFSSIMRDRRQQVAAAAAVRESEARLKLIYRNVSDLMVLMQVERDDVGRLSGFRCESVNEAFARTMGRQPSDYIGRALEHIATPSNLVLLRGGYEAAVRTGLPQNFEIEAAGLNGRFVLESTLTPVKDANGRCTHVLGASRDVTARREAAAALRESEAAFSAMLQTLRTVAVMLDASGKVTFANEALLSLTGWKREHVIGHDWFQRFVPNAQNERAVFDRMIEGAEYFPHFDGEIITCSGRVRLIEWDNTVLHDASGAIIGTASIGQDVTDQRALESRLNTLSEQDELTGLFNRRGFVQRVEDGVAQAQARLRSDALLYIDLDRFKPINDTYGHAAGDDALRAVSALLRSVVRESDVVGRLGGDEFAVYAMCLPEPGGAAALAQRLTDALQLHNEQATAAGRPYAIGFTVGIAEVSGEHTSDSLFAAADAALYARKRRR